MLIRKKYIEKIIKGYRSIKILTGLRQSGKSTLLKQVYEELKNRVSHENMLYINFEERKYQRIHTSQQLNKIIKEFSKKSNDKKYIFLDNIERINDWNYLRAYRYSQEYEFFITVKNSNIRVNENLRNMIGDCQRIEIFPFSFKEVLEYKKQQKGRELSIEEEKESFKEYQKFGGLPKVYSYNQTLKRYVYINKVYKEFLYDNLCILDLTEFSQLILKLLIEDTAQEFSIKNFAHYINTYDEASVGEIFNLSYELLRKYLNYLSRTDLINVCKYYNPKIKVYSNKYQKYYVKDVSFINVLHYKNMDKRNIIETIIYNQLLKMGFKVQHAIFDEDEITFKCHNYHNSFLIHFEESLNDKRFRFKTYDKLNKIDSFYKKIILSFDQEDYSQEQIKHMNIIDFLKQEEC